MTTTTKTRKAGLLVHPDDLAVGGHYAVHSLKPPLMNHFP